jgi:hypothetical protein
VLALPWRCVAFRALVLFVAAPADGAATGKVGQAPAAIIRGAGCGWADFHRP